MDITIYMICGQSIFFEGVNNKDMELFNNSVADESEVMIINGQYRIYKNNISFIKYDKI